MLLYKKYKVLWIQDWYLKIIINVFSLDKSNGKTALLKALLNLRQGENDTIEQLLDIAEKMGDLKNFINAAYTDNYYKGQSFILHTVASLGLERLLYELKQFL